jgi:hypothetical protein
LQGTIELITDGKRLWVKTERWRGKQNIISIVDTFLRQICWGNQLGWQVHWVIRCKSEQVQSL